MQNISSEKKNTAVLNMSNKFAMQTFGNFV